MAPTKPAGRPKIAWTSSRKRKLVRLYLLTNLNIHGIQQVLVATDFTPSTRNIQSQLGDLLPNLSTEWRQYRATGTNQMMDRFAQIRHAKANQVSKYSRRRARFAVDVEEADKGKAKATCSRTNPYYDPCRHYNENLPPGVPSHFLLPQSGAWYCPQSLPMQRQQRSPEALNDCRFSDKEVVADQPGPILPNILDGSRFSDLDAYVAIRSLAADDSTLSLANASEGITTPNELREQQVQASGTSRSSGSNTATTQIRGVKRTRSQLSSIRSINTVRSIGVRSVQSLRDSISSGVSWSLSHIEAALSSSTSLRSSFVYAMSIASDRISTSSDVPLSRDEYLSWDELVDESAFPPTSTQHPETSLQRRDCCEFFEKDTFKRTLCDICGFSEMHQLARCSLSDDSGLIDSSVLDRFGNTPLHHAAAAGNTVRVLQLISSFGIVRARNTSGETFLHVLRLKGGDAFPEYLEILRKASRFGFQFSVLDYYGSTTADKLGELGMELEVSSSRMMEATEILCPFDAFAQKERQEPGFGLNRLKNKFGSSKRSRVKEDNPMYELDSNGDTKLIATLKSWSQRPKSRAELEDLIHESDIHMRDRRGYTALAIAARQGLVEATSLLLQQGANPNTRSKQKTGVVAHATAALTQAKKEGKDLLHARILTCSSLLIDYGGKAVVDAYDEYALPDRTSNKRKQFLGRRPTIRRPNTQHRIAVDEFFGGSDNLPLELQLHSGCIPPAELEETQLSEMPDEPVRSELQGDYHHAEYPLPLSRLPYSPLPYQFPMTELRALHHHRSKKPKLNSGSDFTLMYNQKIRRPAKGRVVELEANQRIKFEDRKQRRRGVPLVVGRARAKIFL
ncbi:hypothetical protein L207DRAFT_634785 [Hyaloscypha variabilis F]|uniref:Ankyrin n=1 Tax=Hyaloscypha variabilis (strain UAMH 11265 / GT02V1 / F) TaxID=1149755 RepID=A0A2J6RJX2_HYAVF|nr:hypothetical protein L207DRAFT_634785 [Hyaloscypha variabilis F]